MAVASLQYLEDIVSAGFLVCWLLQSSRPLFLNVPWVLGVGVGCYEIERDFLQPHSGKAR